LPRLTRMLRAFRRTSVSMPWRSVKQAR
jgi:hypothetical protein